jgi:hypothetical protein
MGLVALTLAALACNIAGSSSGGQLVVNILSPETGSTVAVNSEVTVQATATDAGGPGVIRLDLQVNDVTVDTFEAGGPQPNLTTNLTFTPVKEEAIVVGVIAFREDGTASDPATIALSVVGMTEAPPAEEEAGEEEATSEPAGDEGETEAEAEAETEEPSSEVRVQARAKLQVNIREAPGPGCPIIGVVPEDEVIDLLEVTDDPFDYWYKTDYLGEDQMGWVYHEPFTLLSDDSELPVVHGMGCLFCGDGTCSPEIDETCNNCEEDCGPCCGNGACEPEYGEDCGTCESDCGPCCGNGDCEPGRGENCATCPTDCGECCGNGNCEPEYGEDCATCPADCGDCCGDGRCRGRHGENCYTCPADCGECCGDGACDPAYGEDSWTCPEDCGPY